ncbi:unnamed protein product [Effrenium voratum]|nr:unnamed protein product [Effrenium voratum]
MGVLSQQVVDGQLRYSYASAGNARAVSVHLLRWESRWQMYEYVPAKHALRAPVDASALGAVLPPPPSVALLLRGDVGALDYEPAAKLDLLTQEIGFMKAVLDKSAKCFGWSWQLRSITASQTSVDAILVLASLPELRRML